MAEDLDPLIRDFVEWIAREPRSRAEAMDAWRTSCPRLTVWEDAFDRGFVARAGAMIVVTPAGRAFLSAPRGADPAWFDASARAPGASPREVQRERIN